MNEETIDELVPLIIVVLLAFVLILILLIVCMIISIDFELGIIKQRINRIHMHCEKCNVAMFGKDSYCEECGYKNTNRLNDL